MNQQAIETNLTLIKFELEREIISGDIQAVQDKLLKLTAYIGLSAECIKFAKQNVLYRQKEIINQEAEKFTASILSKKIEGECALEISTLLYAERINAGITHSIDGLRSIISLYKTEMNHSLHP